MADRTRTERTDTPSRLSDNSARIMSRLESLPIPAPQAVREMLAENSRERSLLKSLYRLSLRVVEERQAHARAFGDPSGDVQGSSDDAL